MKKLINSLLNGGFFDTYLSLINLTLANRVDFTKRIFSLACEKNNSSNMYDEKTLLYLRWLLDALDDLEFRDEEHDYDAAIVKRSRARNLVALFPNIPLCAYSTLPLTKEFIFSEIVDRCYKTDDEEESDRLFTFCCSIDFNCSDDRKQLEKIFKEVMSPRLQPNLKADSGISASRLSRHLLIANSQTEEWRKNTLNRPKIQIDEIGKTLFKAWVRSSFENVEEMARVVRILQPLQGTSNEAFKWVGVCADKIAEIDDKYVGQPYLLVPDFSVAHPVKS